MKKRIVALLLTVILLVSAVPVQQASAASYPLIYMSYYDSSRTIPEGEVGYLVFTVWPEYINEYYYIDIYDSYGNLVGSAEGSLYNTSIAPRDVIISVDTYDLGMTPGIYTVEYHMDFYSLYEWHSSPYSYTDIFEVIPNACYGNHDMVLTEIVSESECDYHGHAAYDCMNCAYWEYRELPYAHENDEGVVTVDPTLTMEGEIMYTCTQCGEVTYEVIPPNYGIKVTGWKQEGGKWYYFNGDGELQYGWLQLGGTRYYLNETGVMHTGWLLQGNTWYYFDAHGAMVTGTATIEGKKHRFDAYGAWLGEAPADGWAQEGGKWVYYKNGDKVKGWLYVNNRWYFLDGSGIMQTGWLEINRTKYYLDPYGAMVTGTVTIEGKQHKFDASGAWLGEVTQNGWVWESGSWYYYKDGAKVTGWLYVNNRWYYMNSSGVMQTGWVLLGSTWYYLDASGAMVTGTVTIEGKQHKFDASGAWLGEVTQNGWVWESGHWYYYRNGAKVTGWLQLGDIWYFLDANGVMLTGQHILGGNTYYFDAYGAWVP